VRFFGDIPSGLDVIDRKKAGQTRSQTPLFYEAGPTGYELYRQLIEMGYDCVVVAPALIPKRLGDRVKTNRRDAVSFARLHRAGELTSVWVPDRGHEAMRDLVGARDAAQEAQKRARQELQSFLLRHGRIYPGRTVWYPTRA
jgi:transposase